MSTIQTPPRGSIVSSIRSSCEAARIASNIQISDHAIDAFLTSPLFQTTFNSLKTSHGIIMPLQFSSQAAELNLLAILSLLNFAHGYRMDLRRATGRGAYDNIRAFVFGLYLDSDDDWMSAQGMKTISVAKVAELLQLSSFIHIERPHPTLPGLTVGELGGPLYDLVKLVANVLNETGNILVSKGCKDLGEFVLWALNEGKTETGVDPEVVIDLIVTALPAFQDVGVVQGQVVYVYKKVLFMLHALVLRFTEGGIPLPDTDSLPVFSDNVLPSMLVHLGVLDVSTSTLPVLRTAFPDLDVSSALSYTPTVDQGGVVDNGTKQGGVKVNAGAVLSSEEAYGLRAAAVDACEQIVRRAKSADHIGTGAGGWITDLSLPTLDGFLWAIAKEGKMRSLTRFAQMGTVLLSSYRPRVSGNRDSLVTGTDWHRAPCRRVLSRIDRIKVVTYYDSGVLAIVNTTLNV